MTRPRWLNVALIALGVCAASLLASIFMFGLFPRTWAGLALSMLFALPAWALLELIGAIGFESYAPRQTRYIEPRDPNRWSDRAQKLVRALVAIALLIGFFVAAVWVSEHSPWFGEQFRESRWW